MENALDTQFVRALRCPATGQSLTFLCGEHPVLASLPPHEVGEGILLCADGLGFYPVRGGIPVLLVEELRTAVRSAGA